MTVHAMPQTQRTLDHHELTAALALRDLTDPEQGPHAMQLLLDQITQALTTSWRMPLHLERTSPLVSIRDNYDLLGYAGDEVTRQARYTRYLSPTVMLRSHTSAAIPAALRTLPDRGHSDELIVAAGLTYRRDVVDRSHVGEPHQVDLWRVSTRYLGEAELEEMITLVVEAILPGAQWRTTATDHPYTVAGRQVDVRLGNEWLELAECGLIARPVLQAAGLPAPGWNGLALGLGLDRALMLRKGIDDIRWLRSTHPRALEQWDDLQPWRPISRLPALRRDLSLVVAASDDDQTLGDRARLALGDQVADVESIQVLQRTPAAELPEAARQRLGLADDQVNLLLRLTIRPLQHTLTAAQANRLRDRVYLALHQGPVVELAC